MKKATSSFILAVAALSILSVPLFASAQVNITISTSVPGRSSVSILGPGAFVSNFYDFALMIGGVLAFGAIIYGGVKYMASAGNPSSQSDAKEWIESALLGLLLLVGAYFILDVINPQLLNLALPKLAPLNIQVSTGGGGGGGGNTATGCAGSGCQDLAAAGMTCKPASEQPNHQESCSAAQGMVNTLQCIQGKVGSSDFTVTEAMPPTVAHESSCHQDGCCVDTTVNNFTSCAQVNALVQAATACHATVANEYKNCGGKVYSTTEGDNIHINSASGGGC